jgi:glycosyltransferase involved in cell wall biosynthesis
MRIVIHDYGAYPFTLQLAHGLAARRHHVLYLYSTGLITPKASVEHVDDSLPTLSVEPLSLGRTATRSAGLKRLMQERRYGCKLAARIAIARPDFVLSANTPLDAQATALEATHAAGGIFGFWMQDYYSRAVQQLLSRRIPIVGRLIGERFAKLETRLLMSADLVIAASASFLPRLRDLGLREDAIFFIPNWAPLSGLPLLPRNNEWAVQHGLSDVPVLLYSGTLGRKHNPSMLMALARGLPHTKVVVVSEGVGTNWLRSRSSHLPNLTLLPLQPPTRLPAVLASADVLVALLERDAAEFSEPSKLLTYLAAGKPILAAIPAENPGADLIRSTHAGVVVEPTDVVQFVGAAQKLLDDTALRDESGNRGYAYAIKRYEIESIVDKFEATFLARGTASRLPVKRRGTPAW